MAEQAKWAGGDNYRLSDILAAVGVAQLRKLSSLISIRRSLAATYTQLLRDVPGITPPHLPEWGGHVYQSYVTTLEPNIDRDRIIRSLADDGIETTLGTYALHAEPYFQAALDHVPGDMPNAWRAYRSTLTLPLYPQMALDDQERVVSSLRGAMRTAAAKA